jgi:alkanesulfonate monooxygenase
MLTELATGRSLTLYSTCPPYRGADPEAYMSQVARIAQWSEEGGCDGILVYTDNGLLDPWLAAQIVIQSTRSLSPLVAVQPIYMHPYTVAKLVTTLAYLHHRRIDLNMVAGGFKNDLIALNDTTPHDQRYVRLVEYTQIIQLLLTSPGPVTQAGSFYSVSNLTLSPPLDSSLAPRVLMSGSSTEGLAAARMVNALSVQYPGPASQTEAEPLGGERGFGIRVGIIARADEEEAWSIAQSRFPEDRRGQVTHQLAMKISDSAWHAQLSALNTPPAARSTYWTVPFQNYKTFCPYLVGSYEQVGDELKRYLAAGCTHIILDVPGGEDEFDHIHCALVAAADPVSHR